MKHASDAVVAASVVGKEVGAQAEVRRQLPSLQVQLHQQMLLAQRDARRSGRQSLSSDLDREVASVVDTYALDSVAAIAASGTLSTTWATAALSAVASWDGKRPLARELAELPRSIEPSVQRTGATETAKAFNDERSGALGAVSDLFGDAGGDHDDGDGRRLAPGLFKVFSAVLDRVTCTRCFGADGEIVDARDSFRAGAPPLHPWCRCIVEHIIIAKPERLEDIGIDYALFKEELRDVIRERREISDKRALAFISDSLGDKRSAEVLAKRFADEAYATERATSGRFTFVTPTKTK